MANPLVKVVERGVVRVGYSTANFEAAVRGLLTQPLLDRGLSSARVEEVVGSVFAREETGSTSSGAIALPHARVAGLPEIVAGLGTNPNGIYPEGTTRLMLAFVTPAEAAGEHLMLLSYAARRFRDASFLRQAESAESAEALLDLLREG